MWMMSLDMIPSRRDHWLRQSHPLLHLVVLMRRALLVEEQQVENPECKEDDCVADCEIDLVVEYVCIEALSANEFEDNLNAAGDNEYVIV